MLAAEPDFEVIAEAADGEAAWKCIQKHRPDIAILDLNMPKASGIDVARCTERAGLDTRCLMLSMYSHPAAVQEALQVGAAGYVLKDNSFEELVAALRIVGAGGTFVSPTLGAKLRDLRRNRPGAAALSAREQEVAHLLATGRSSKEIGRHLSISPLTVDTYRRRLMEKLGLHSVKEVVRYAVESGMMV